MDREAWWASVHGVTKSPQGRKRWQHTYHLISINQQVYKLFTFEKKF